MRKRLGALLTVSAVVAALVGVSSGPAGAQTVVSQPFRSFGTGTVISANILQLGQTQALNLQAAFGAQTANSQGMAGPLFNEMGYVIQPAEVNGLNAYGRGTGLELGLLTAATNPEPNQVLLTGLAQAAAPPPSTDEKQIGPIAVGAVAFAQLLRGRAAATFDPNICVIGKPLSFGKGDAAGLQLVGTSTGPTTPLTAPLVGAALPVDTTDPRNTSSSNSVSYLIPNGDGTFGLVSETRQTIAPIALLSVLGPSLTVTLELLGEWALRAIATGKPGGARIEYAPVGAGPTTNVATLTLGGATLANITAQQLFGTGGLNLASIAPGIAALANITLGTPARALGGTGAPLVAADGTSASAAAPPATVSLLTLPGISGLDLRVGHMEASVQVPPGGIRCNIPVNKTATPDPVLVGQNFTITITIPSDAAQFAQLFGCNLVNIRAVDVHVVAEGNASFQLTGASNGGVISGDGTTVTWENLGTYTIGDPPIQLTVTGTIPLSSGAGTLQDTATVTATLGGCQGGAFGEDIVGQAVSGGLVSGSFTLVGPSVSRGQLAATGGGDTRLLLMGGVVLLGALALRRRIRRPSVTSS